MLAGGTGGLGPARVHDEDPPAPRLDGLERPGRVGDLEEAPLRDDRVGPHDDEAADPLQIGERLGEREAVDLAGHRELVRAVLGRRRVHRSGADPGEEPLGEDRVEHAEAGRRAHVHRDAVRPVVGAQLPDLRPESRGAPGPSRSSPSGRRCASPAPAGDRGTRRSRAGGAPSGRRSPGSPRGRRRRAPSPRGRPRPRRRGRRAIRKSGRRWCAFRPSWTSWIQRGRRARASAIQDGASGSFDHGAISASSMARRRADCPPGLSPLFMSTSPRASWFGG